MLNDRYLYEVADRVTLAEGREISRRLFDELRRHNKYATKPKVLRRHLKTGDAPPLAAGLSAPQVGLRKAVCVLHHNGFVRTLVNPRIVAWSNGKQMSREGCLSFPGLSLGVWRHTWVRVQCDNWARPEEFGREDVAAATAAELWQAAAVQHEVAHCYGLTLHNFIQRDHPTPDAWAQWNGELNRGRVRQEEVAP
jgi:peptide deformylase